MLSLVGAKLFHGVNLSTFPRLPATQTMADHTERPPPSKRAKRLGTPPLESQPPKLDSDAAPSAMHLTVEAFGSGVLLLPDLAVSTDQTVGDLRQSVFSAVNCPSNTRSIRLFVGHGGTELDNDTLLVADSAIAGEDDKPLVMFPTICTSPTCHARVHANGCEHGRISLYDHL